MLENKKIKTALVSVFHKDGLDEILKLLHAEGVNFISTGGTQSFIESLGITCGSVENLTGYPSILGGRVKTLHPKVFGGILNRRENEVDQQQITQYEIPSIDLVIVDLYPFEETVASGADESAIIEKIDIGGISLIRAAAKNYKDVVIVASKAQYAPLLAMLKEKGASSSLTISTETRLRHSAMREIMPRLFDMVKILIRKESSTVISRKCSINFMERKFPITIYWT